MDALTPIPASFRSHWRRWHGKVAHVVVFLSLCTGSVIVWQKLQSSLTFVGQVETIQTIVSSRDAGFITNLWVTLLQEVKTGDLVAEVVTTDPRTVNNRLEVIRDRMRLIALEMEPILSRQRTALAYEQLSVDCDRIKGEMDVARVKLEQAQSQLKRDEILFQQGSLSAELFELSRRNKEAYQAELLGKSNLVQRTEKTLERLKSVADTFVPGGESDPIRQAIELEEDKARVFEAKLLPLRLESPTNGIVTEVHRHAGEQIIAGEPIATITSPHGTRIVGYLPRNFPITPRVGMPVEVCTRTTKRVKGCATVLGVSPYLEFITNSLVAPISVQHVFIPTMGRKVSVSMPAGLELLPGEPVDLTLLDKPPRAPRQNAKVGN
jgi:multidrug resistance efflux pump